MSANFNVPLSYDAAGMASHAAQMPATHFATGAQPHHAYGAGSALHDMSAARTLRYDVHLHGDASDTEVDVGAKVGLREVSWNTTSATQADSDAEYVVLGMRAVMDGAKPVRVFDVQSTPRADAQPLTLVVSASQLVPRMQQPLPKPIAAPHHAEVAAPLMAPASELFSRQMRSAADQGLVRRVDELTLRVQQMSTELENVVAPTDMMRQLQARLSLLMEESARQQAESELRLMRLEAQVAAYANQRVNVRDLHTELRTVRRSEWPLPSESDGSALGSDDGSVSQSNASSASKHESLASSRTQSRCSERTSGSQHGSRSASRAEKEPRRRDVSRGPKARAEREHDTPVPSAAREEEALQRRREASDAISKGLRPQDIERMDLVPIKVGSEEDKKMSLYHFNGTVAAAGLTSIAYPVDVDDEVDPVLDQMLQRLVQRWVKSNDDIVKAIATHVGMHCTMNGAELFRWVREGYIDSSKDKKYEAQTKLNAFGWNALWTGDDTKLRKESDKLWPIVNDLGDSRAHDSLHWIGQLTDRMPGDVRTEMTDIVQKMPDASRAIVGKSIPRWIAVAGLALNNVRRRIAQGSVQSIGEQSGLHRLGNPGGGGGGGGGDGDKVNTKFCACCKGYSCLGKGKTEAEAKKVCDVLSSGLSAERKQYIANKPRYMTYVIEMREKKRKPKLTFPPANTVAAAPAAAPAAPAAPAVRRIGASALVDRAETQATLMAQLEAAEASMNAAASQSAEPAVRMHGQPVTLRPEAATAPLLAMLVSATHELCSPPLTQPPMGLRMMVHEDVPTLMHDEGSDDEDVPALVDSDDELCEPTLTASVKHLTAANQPHDKDELELAAFADPYAPLEQYIANEAAACQQLAAYLQRKKDVCAEDDWCERFCDEHGIRHTQSLAHEHNSNARVERCIRSLEMLMRASPKVLMHRAPQTEATVLASDASGAHALRARAPGDAIAVPDDDFILYLCSGPRHPGDFFEAAHAAGTNAIMIDLDNGHDITVEPLKSQLVSMASLPRMIAGMASGPCGPWAVARMNDNIVNPPPPLHDVEFPEGIPRADGSLPPTAVRAHAVHMAIIAIFRVANQYGKPLVMETPVGRGLGQELAIIGRERHVQVYAFPPMAEFIDDIGARGVIYDQILLGASTQKSTELMCSPSAYKAIYTRFAHLRASHFDVKPVDGASCIGRKSDGSFNSAGSERFSSANNVLLVESLLDAVASQRAAQVGMHAIVGSQHALRGWHGTVAGHSPNCTLLELTQPPPEAPSAGASGEQHWLPNASLGLVLGSAPPAAADPMRVCLHHAIGHKVLDSVASSVCKRDPSACVFDASGFKWQTSTVQALLDSGADMSVIPDRRAFVYMEPPVPDQVKVGKAATYLRFVGMGPVVFAAAATIPGESERRMVGVFIERAYLPEEEDGDSFILSLGRMWAQQGIYITEQDADIMHIGDVQVKFGRRHYTPVMAIVLPDFEPAVFSIKTPAAKRPSHFSGAPKYESRTLAHLRYGHLNWEALAQVQRWPAERCMCDVCNTYKQRMPDMPVLGEQRSLTFGERLYVDTWKSTVPCAALGTGWTDIICSCEESQGLVLPQGCVEPTGKICAAYVKYLIIVYRAQFSTDIVVIRFDNATVFDCEEVKLVLADMKVRWEFTAPYMHGQMMMERHWDTAARGGACMLATSRRGKGLYLHAVLHKLILMSLLGASRHDKTKTRWQVATGAPFAHMDAIRIFGSDSWGFLPIEQRQQLRLDKADPRAVKGFYVGVELFRPTIKIVTIAKLHACGAGIVDEKTLLARSPVASGQSTDGMLPIADGGDTAVRFGGNAVVPTVVDSSANPQATTQPAVADSMDTGALQRAVEAPAPPSPADASKRPRRATQKTVRYAPPPTARPAPVARASVPKPKPEQYFIVPRAIWRDYKCDELDGKGWLAQAVGGDKTHIKLRFVHARTAQGVPYNDVRLMPGSVIACDANGNPLVEEAAEANADGMVASFQFVGSFLDNPPPYLAEMRWSAFAHREDPTPPVNMVCGDSVADPHAAPSLALIDQAFATQGEQGHVMLMHAAQASDAQPVRPSRDKPVTSAKKQAKVAKSKKPNMQACTDANGITVFRPVPATWKQAQQMPNAVKWEAGMQAFLDKTAAVDGFRVCDSEEAYRNGQPARLGWVFKWKWDPDLELWVENARLVWDATSVDGAATATFASMVRTIHWKGLLHATLADGGNIHRRDIVNAHQSTRVGPDMGEFYSFPPPGSKLLAPSGRIGYFNWLNILNGMPPAGNAFTSLLHRHFLDFGFTQILTDDYVYVLFFEHGGYLKIATEADDYLIFELDARDELAAFDAHMEKKWGIKKSGLDGFNNMQFYMSQSGRFVTICMDVKIVEIMHEHLPHMIDSTALPETPCHPRLRELALGDDSFDPEDASRSRRLGAQEIWLVTQAYLTCQFAVFFAARFCSKPSQLHLECNEYVLLHLYGTRHLGHTVGSDGSERSVSSQCTVGAHSDAGHAESGPSMGGHSIELDGTTVHVFCGQHHATTLGTTDSEMYELSRCVATTIAFRSFVSEIGYPQLSPSDVQCDSSGACLKANSSASDKRSLYMKRRVRFAQDAVTVGECNVVHIDGTSNRADVLTKPLAAALYKQFRDLILNVQNAVQGVRKMVFGK